MRGGLPELFYCSFVPGESVRSKEFPQQTSGDPNVAAVVLEEFVVLLRRIDTREAEEGKLLREVEDGLPMLSPYGGWVQTDSIGADVAEESAGVCLSVFQRSGA